MRLEPILHNGVLAGYLEAAQGKSIVMRHLACEVVSSTTYTDGQGRYNYRANDLGTYLYALPDFGYRSMSVWTGDYCAVPS